MPFPPQIHMAADALMVSGVMLKPPRLKFMNTTHTLTLEARVRWQPAKPGSLPLVSAVPQDMRWVLVNFGRCMDETQRM